MPTMPANVWQESWVSPKPGDPPLRLDAGAPQKFVLPVSGALRPRVLLWSCTEGDTQIIILHSNYTFQGLPPPNLPFLENWILRGHFFLFHFLPLII